MQSSNDNHLTPMPRDNGFESWWDWCFLNLNTILKSKHEGSNKAKSKIGIYRMLNQSKKDFYQFDKKGPVALAHIKNFIEDLDYLQVKNQEYFNEFRSKFNSGASNQYGYLTGFWFEIRIARMLLESGFSFTRPDPPDFLIKYNSSLIGIECFAPRIPSGESDKTVLKKAIRAIKDKTRDNYGKDWIKNPSALFLDFTWIIGARVTEEAQIQEMISGVLKHSLVEAAKESYFDIIAFFIFAHCKDSQNNRTTTCLHISDPTSTSKVKKMVEELLSRFKEANYKVILPSMPT